MALSNYQSSPGVYVREIDLSQRIKSTSRTIGAIVGASKTGPMNETTLITSTQEFISVFGQPDPNISMMHYAALSFLEESGTLYVTRVVKTDALSAGVYLTCDDPKAAKPILRLTNFDDGTSNPRGIFDPINNLGFVATDPAVNNTLLYICAANPGEWNNQLSVQVRPSNKPQIAVGVGHDPYEFYIDVYVNYTGPRNQPVESFLVNRVQSTSGFGLQLYVEEINRTSQYIRVKNNVFCGQIPVLQNAFEFLAGGTNGSLPNSYDIINAWQLYTDTETLNINIMINGGYAIPEVQLAMNDIAAARMDCICLLDIPSDQQQTADAITYRSEILNLDSSYSAIYTPDVKIKDPYNDIEIFVPLSGFAAAICARTDKVSQLWNAPAGLNRGLLSVLGIRHVYNQAARDAFDDAQINMLRYFPDGQGIAIWSQATMQVMASALSNLNVRRLLNFLEKEIAAASLYSVFETNDIVLRSKLTTLVEGFLKPIKNNRGLLDFAVICDDSNNTPATIASGDCILDVYLDPTLPAKRIHLNAVITKTGAIFQETLVNTSATGITTA